MGGECGREINLRVISAMATRGHTYTDSLGQKSRPAGRGRWGRSQGLGQNTDGKGRRRVGSSRATLELEAWNFIIVGSLRWICYTGKR